MSLIVTASSQLPVSKAGAGRASSAHLHELQRLRTHEHSLLGKCCSVSITASPEAQLIRPQPILSLPAVHAPRPFTSPHSLQRPTNATGVPKMNDAQASASCALSIPQKRLSNQARPTEWRMACGTELSTRDVRVMLDSDKCALRITSGRLRSEVWGPAGHEIILVLLTLVLLTASLLTCLAILLAAPTTTQLAIGKAD